MTLQQTPPIPPPPRAQPEQIKYSNTPHFSTLPIDFANTNKTSSSELPQPIHTASNMNEAPNKIFITGKNNTTHSLSLKNTQTIFQPDTQAEPQKPSTRK